jgi:hypothetical protein
MHPEPAAAIDFEVVKETPERQAAPSIPAKKKGRPLRLTEPRFHRMLALIREGNTNTAACRIEGITYQSWRQHIHQKPEWRAELAIAEQIRDEVWRDHALEMVKNAMPKNWVAAMTFLERKWPNEFALKTVVRNLNSTEAQVFDRVSQAELAENARIAAAAALNPPPGLAAGDTSADNDNPATVSDSAALPAA